MSDDRLQQIEARASAATPGPWEWRGKCGSLFRLSNEPDGPRYSADRVITPTYEYDSGVDTNVSDADAAFIAEARADIPWLLAELRQSRAEVAQLEAKFQQAFGCHHSWVSKGMDAIKLEAERDQLRADLATARDIIDTIARSVPEDTPHDTIADFNMSDENGKVRYLRDICKRWLARAGEVAK